MLLISNTALTKSTVYTNLNLCKTKLLTESQFPQNSVAREFFHNTAYL